MYLEALDYFYYYIYIFIFLSKAIDYSYQKKVDCIFPSYKVSCNISLPMNEIIGISISYHFNGTKGVEG